MPKYKVTWVSTHPEDAGTGTMFDSWEAAHALVGELLYTGKDGATITIELV